MIETDTTKEIYRVQDRNEFLPGVWACVVTAEGYVAWEPVVNLIERDVEGNTLNPNDPRTVIHRRNVVTGTINENH